MTLFWVYAALLAGVALAFLVTPLMRGRARAGATISRAASNLTVFRDQLAELDADLAAGTIGREQWEAARGDLQRGLLEGVGPPAASAAAPAKRSKAAASAAPAKRSKAAASAAVSVKRSKAAAIAIGIALPLASVFMYLGLGSPQGLDPRKESAAQGASHQLTQEQIESLVERLAKRLESNPDDAEGWSMLARTYSTLGRFAEAAGAYAKAEAKFPKNAQLLADYADSLAMAQGQSLQGRPEALVRRALQADGNNLKALALAGTVEFEKRDFAKAIEYWRRMLPLLPPDSEMVDSVRASIKEAEDKHGGAPKSSTLIAQEKQGGASKSSAAAAKAVRVSGTIKLAPALAARAAPEDIVFVLARPAQGSRMPLAAVRVKVRDLPLAFSFDDSMAMNPSSKLTDFAEVVVAARVSKSGNVVPQGGDMEGVSKPVRPGTTGIIVEIANVVQ
jgi:cytochrome c-type biogenesis protein CcmH